MAAATPKASNKSAESGRASETSPKRTRVAHARCPSAGRMHATVAAGDPDCAAASASASVASPTPCPKGPTINTRAARARPRERDAAADGRTKSIGSPWRRADHSCLAKAGRARPHYELAGSTRARFSRPRRPQKASPPGRVESARLYGGRFREMVARSSPDNTCCRANVPKQRIGPGKRPRRRTASAGGPHSLAGLHFHHQHSCTKPSAQGLNIKPWPALMTRGYCAVITANCVAHFNLPGREFQWLTGAKGPSVVPKPGKPAVRSTRPKSHTLLGLNAAGPS